LPSPQQALVHERLPSNVEQEYNEREYLPNKDYFTWKTEDDPIPAYLIVKISDSTLDGIEDTKPSEDTQAEDRNQLHDNLPGCYCSR
jgi:hypothetical protein